MTTHHTPGNPPEANAWLKGETRKAELECAFENLCERDLEVLSEALAGRRGDVALELREAIDAHMEHMRAAGYWR